jgi:hypothetical protein
MSATAMIESSNVMRSAGLLVSGGSKAATGESGLLMSCGSEAVTGESGLLMSGGSEAVTGESEGAF